MNCNEQPQRRESTNTITRRQRKLSSLNLKHRNYCSAKVLSTQPTEPSISKPPHPTPLAEAQNQPPKEPSGLKKYCLTKFRVTHNR